MENLITDQIKDEYIQWLKDNGKLKQEPRDIYVNINGEMKIETRMAWTMNTSPQDWQDFCESTGREYEGEMKLLAIY